MTGILVTFDLSRFVLLAKVFLGQFLLDDDHLGELPLQLQGLLGQCRVVQLQLEDPLLPQLEPPLQLLQLLVVVPRHAEAGDLHVADNLLEDEDLLGEAVVVLLDVVIAHLVVIMNILQSPHGVLQLLDLQMCV